MDLFYHRYVEVISVWGSMVCVHLYVIIVEKTKAVIHLIIYILYSMSFYRLKDVLIPKAYIQKVLGNVEIHETELGLLLPIYAHKILSNFFLRQICWTH